jgi:hypothetical protein
MRRILAAPHPLPASPKMKTNFGGGAPPQNALLSILGRGWGGVDFKAVQPSNYAITDSVCQFSLESGLDITKTAQLGVGRWVDIFVRIRS